MAPIEENNLIVSLGADHAGMKLKNKIKALIEKKYAVTDRGTSDEQSVDYPDYARIVAKDVAQGNAKFGILVCGSGTGMAIAANKIEGVRAANCWTVEIARLARQHNNANVLALPARFIDEAEALKCVEAFLETEFEGGRHAGRVQKIEC